MITISDMCKALDKMFKRVKGEINLSHGLIQVTTLFENKVVDTFYEVHFNDKDASCIVRFNKSYISVTEAVFYKAFNVDYDGAGKVKYRIKYSGDYLKEVYETIMTEYENYK